MRIRCAKKSETGVTLVDVVMSIALLGVMASGVIGSFRYGLFVMELARENQRATQVMLEKLETIRLFNWDQVNPSGRALPYSFPFSAVYDPQASANSQGVTYQGTVTVSTCTNSPSYSTNMRQLTINLSWTTRNIPHTRSITTYVAKDGIQNYVY